MRVVMTLLGVAAAIGAVLGVVVHYVPITHQSVVIAAVAAPYLMLGAPLAALLLLVARRWLLAAVAVALTVVAVVVQLPLYVTDGEAPPSSAATVRVLTANLGMGEADPVALTALARGSADVLLVQEMTAEAVAGLQAAGIDKTFPHRVLDPRKEASGIGIWSRYPMSESTVIAGFAMPWLRARLAVPGLADGLAVAAIHFGAPWPQPIDGWRSDITRLPDVLRSLGPGPVIVAGDFNSTMTMRPFRQLLTDGFRDAGEQAGAGLARTYPNRPPWPAVLGIDHVLVRGGVATSVHPAPLPGSDHRALLATVQIPSA